MHKFKLYEGLRGKTNYVQFKIDFSTVSYWEILHICGNIITKDWLSVDKIKKKGFQKTCVSKLWKYLPQLVWGTRQINKICFSLRRVQLGLPASQSPPGVVFFLWHPAGRTPVFVVVLHWRPSWPSSADVKYLLSVSLVLLWLSYNLKRKKYLSFFLKLIYRFNSVYILTNWYLYTRT